MKDKLLSRRRFFRQASLLLPLGLAKDSQSQDAHHINPEHSDVSTTLRNDLQDPELENLNQIYSKKVTSLKGLDPMRTLTTFDWGETEITESGRVRRMYTVIATEERLEVAPGLFFDAWTYNGSVPGPTLRCRQGDRLRINFQNRSAGDHTMHFHGIHPADMDGVLPIVRPGQNYTYEFDAEPAGLHIYHCHVPPVDLHISRGMFGAFLVEPEEPFKTAKELMVIMHGWDINFDQKIEVYAINGCANFYRDNPISISRDELVRIFLVNALEYEPSISFHTHGNFFNRIKLNQRDQSILWEDVVTLAQAQRCILEFSYRFKGLFMFHPHQSIASERGAMGHFDVT